MKYTILILLLSNMLLSQTDIKFNIGLKYGYNNNIFTGVDSNNEFTGLLTDDMYGAVFFNFKIQENKFFDFEILYSSVNDFQFLEFPFIYKQELYKKIYGKIGPRIDLLLDENAQESYRFDVFSLSLQFGLEYLITKKIFLESSYSIGFRKQLLEDKILDINDAKRNTFRVGVGYKF